VTRAGAARSSQCKSGRSLFLTEDDGWTSKYKPGTLPSKLVAVFTKKIPHA